MYGYYSRAVSNQEQVIVARLQYSNFLAQGSDLAPCIGNGTKVKIPFEIKQPLILRCYVWMFPKTIMLLLYNVRLFCVADFVEVFV